ncbi:hypothetical protein B296_00028466 [Ensete ventricosum]|uniref:Uncharacterized protein n=1 Tax=Ensete ventricosum TaxID=4639 RepID=A0A426YLY1_ENSVE|nr:hypothetical protein B296_00028466 [Ensete ventricosum]
MYRTVPSVPTHDTLGYRSVLSIPVLYRTGMYQAYRVVWLIYHTIGCGSNIGCSSTLRDWLHIKSHEKI